MGFKVNRKGYRLTFADGSALDGATIVMGSLTVDELLALGETAEAAGAAVAAAGTSTSELEAMQNLKVLIADKLISWDLEEEDGTPIPADMAGVGSLEVEWLMLLVAAWTGALSAVDPSLGKESPSGAISLEASIPMEVNSPSLAS